MDTVFDCLPWKFSLQIDKKLFRLNTASAQLLFQIPQQGGFSAAMWADDGDGIIKLFESPFSLLPGYFLREVPNILYALSSERIVFGRDHCLCCGQHDFVSAWRKNNLFADALIINLQF